MFKLLFSDVGQVGECIIVRSDGMLSSDLLCYYSAYDTIATTVAYISLLKGGCGLRVEDPILFFDCNGYYRGVDETSPSVQTSS